MIRFENVSKTFVTKDREVTAVKNMDLHIKKGKISGIIGYSGAGKSTLVRCINLLERPTEGKVFLGDVELTALKEKELRKERQKIGMIFQQFNLLSQRTALANVCYPLELTGTPKKEIKKKALELLELVGLSDRAGSYPAQLSGGQKQRVAIARALATDPEVLLCDEATSALDPNTTNQILELLQSINRKLGVTIVIITHEMKVVQQICDEVAVVAGGEIVESGEVKEVFINPQSQIAKDFILPKNETLDVFNNEKVLRIVFDGQSAFEPIIANLALKCHSVVNILGATTENIGGKAVGQMLLQLPEDELAVARIKTYLDSIKIKYEESEYHGTK
ncbi:MAG: ATP-binding cassette domain-containing protein [bacterium]|nr:ATP-binding cassette domain-containing protein [bacterium]